GERMKMREEHRVPLSDAAVAILEEVREFTGGGELVFSGRDGELSNMALMGILRRMGYDVTVHGFRSTFRDWAAEQTNFPREVCELCLAHKIAGAVEKAYQRGDLLAKRTLLMQAWADYCSKPMTPARVHRIWEAAHG